MVVVLAMNLPMPSIVTAHNLPTASRHVGHAGQSCHSSTGTSWVEES